MDTSEVADQENGTEEEKEGLSGGSCERWGDNLQEKESRGRESGAASSAESSSSASEESLKGTLRITPLAIEKIKEISTAEGLPNSRLRVKVVGGGCAGFAYDITFDEKLIEVDGEEKLVPAEPDDPLLVGDRIWLIDGVNIVVDVMSLMYINGTEIDYVEGLLESGFKFNNPNVKNTCGCGSSFQV